MSDELWPSVPATPDARLTTEQPAPASRGVVGGPTVPESLPPGREEGTPPSRRFERGVLSGNATTREREPSDSSVAPPRASVAETQAHGVSSSPADALHSGSFHSRACVNTPEDIEAFCKALGAGASVIVNAATWLACFRAWGRKADESEAIYTTLMCNGVRIHRSHAVPAGVMYACNPQVFTEASRLALL